MTTSTKDELDRNTSGRFVRNLALSLSGGALLTLIGAGATVASADDGTAGTAADGQGHAGTGDATAVGNQSGTNTTQTVTVSGNLGTIQVINQQANVVNAGIGIANTGGNIAIGNGSQNDANATQNSSGGATGAFNNGDATNNSNGGALINTGNASAIGNQSDTNILQEAHGNISGSLGSILVINQDANVLNAGVALANTGGNIALGNESNNRSDLLQEAQSAGLATNNGSATTDSNGKATINTGNASATGNKSNTNITQRASGSAGGSMGGLLIIDQDANVFNVGAAVANTGINGAVGNASGSLFGENIANLGQEAEAINPANPDIGIASNNGEASNYSDGTARITTGDANAVGNDSETTINQSATGNVGLNGLSLVDQDANVFNVGIAAANSGVNGALGNGASSAAAVAGPAGPPSLQEATVEGFSDIGVAGNFGKATNASDGTGIVHTGKANAAGTRSKDSITQSAEAEGGAFDLQDQDSNIVNFGVGVANSGINGTAGNLSRNTAGLGQNAELEPPAGGEIDTAVAGQFGLASNASDGTAEVVTGDANAVGNQSSTDITQAIDPTGITIQTQNATVLNVGVGIANSGGNGAIGNASDNDGGPLPGAFATQDATIDPATNLDADTLVVSNNGEASNSSDGYAHITTGTASATGNESYTKIGQTADAGVPGDGLAINPQTAFVLNGGVALANSGGNVAVGNISQNDAVLDQTVTVGGDDISADTLIASNNGTASNASDGTGHITTGNAAAVGNHSRTELYQAADASVVGSGIALNPQTGVVLNVGVGVANSGINGAVGNASNNSALLDQDVLLNGPGGDIDTDLLLASNQGEASNASDGTGKIKTGTAQATGNTSHTLFVQNATGNVDGDGVVLNTQNGLVVNGGLAVANSGVNGALGNVSQQDPDAAGATLTQRNFINEDGVNLDADAVIGSNTGTASNASDGTGDIRTGDAQAQGNVSSTIFTQVATGTIGADGAGIVPNIQNGAVLNLGAGVANSGVNGAVGNASGVANVDFDPTDPAAVLGFVITPSDGNIVSLDQESDLDPQDDLDVDGPATSYNQGTAANNSDGTGKVHTGGAFASGNVSASNLTQRINGTVDGGGLVVAPQNGAIVNVGVGVANSGINAAIGNISTSEATATQEADFESVDGPAPGDLTVDPALTVGNTGHATNDSDGFACTCTGNAWASGNISSSTLTQDMEIGVEDGLSVVPTTGLILNAGFGLANSGVNLSIGNLSDNTATTIQTTDLLQDGELDGAQTFINGGGASNASNGTGKVGSGNAKAIGNHSTSDLTQAAVVDGAGAFAAINGNIANVGAGLANSGINLGLGNDSSNVAFLEQAAEGEGTVANQGEAANNSDGFGGVGDPLCEDEVPGTPAGPTTPGLPSLPKTGGPLEVEAAIGLMLLLAGFGFRRASKKLG